MLSFKVAAKGGVSVYGLGRFPVTLYESQWRALIAEIPALTEFLDANSGNLKQRPSRPVYRDGSPGYDHAAGYHN